MLLLLDCDDIYHGARIFIAYLHKGRRDLDDENISLIDFAAFEFIYQYYFRTHIYFVMMLLYCRRHAQHASRRKARRQSIYLLRMISMPILTYWHIVASNFKLRRLIAVMPHADDIPNALPLPLACIRRNLKYYLLYWSSLLTYLFFITFTLHKVAYWLIYRLFSMR